ncbi:hypothetical protein JET14_05915 [Martelella lutilitoris]|uniref:Type VI secretion system-associated protein TagO n=1 Tax=Martelella lutilitoris TaxID=2583532 RepID=A0A7T7HM16_9HYPH|nr:type VI secretion system-associated protein TagO [Martelella lutilitoris]QQM31703.1 hypothetical protein JET14_05915 [Martelella lutilitoris]
MRGLFYATAISLLTLTTVAAQDDLPEKPDVSLCMEYPADSAISKKCLARAMATDGQIADYIGDWYIQIDTSPMDDTKTVAMLVSSNEEIPGRFGQSDTASMLIRCLENTTSIHISLNGNFLSDIQGYGNVEYRLDKETARSQNMHVSSDNSALGLWSGNRSIPFIRRMFDNDQMLVRITPYNGNPIMVTFPIKGLEKAIQPLREACHW